MKYPKIQTLWKRDTTKKNVIIPGQFSLNEFRSVNNWIFTEKIDGTNIRIEFTDGKVQFQGREDNSQIPARLVNYLKDKFTEELMGEVFSDLTSVESVTLFCEGFGDRIQKSGKFYLPDRNEVILFDVLTGCWWLERNSVEDVASKLGIRCVPTIPDIRDLKEALQSVENGFRSLVAEQSVKAEGIVARSNPQMLFRDKSPYPIMWKLKTRDYEQLKRIGV